MKDLTTGKVYATKAFREKHGAKLAKVGIDLGKPQPEGRLIEGWVETLSDEEADAIAKHLGLIENGEHQRMVETNGYTR